MDIITCRHICRPICDKIVLVKQNFFVFIIRWILCSLGFWLAISFFDGRTVTDPGNLVWAYLLAGLIFSIVNSVLKPILVVLALPAIVITLGLFMLVVNGLLVYISIALVPGIDLTFFQSILTGILLSLINYIVSAAFELRSSHRYGD